MAAVPEAESALKALADRSRLRILNLLGGGESCVCAIHEALGLNQSNASRHLEKLKNAGLIVGEKRGLWVYYRLEPGLAGRLPFIGPLLAGLARGEPYRSDLRKMKRARPCRAPEVGR